MTVKVKPLVWVDCVFSGQPAFYADTEFGPWAVTAYTGRDGNWAHTDPTGEDSEEDWALAEDAKAAAQADYEARILAAIEAPDHLALVAAAYRDAADVVKSVRAMLCAEEIRAKTPSDAEARLTALLRAEYERGVREAAKACDWGDIYGDNAVRCILALLTQEGR